MSSFRELNEQYESAQDKLDPAEQEEQEEELPVLKTYEVSLAISNTEVYKVEANNEDEAYEKVMTEELTPDRTLYHASEFVGCEEVS